MARRYSRTLNVSTPDGERIYAIVTQGLDTAHIEVRFLEVVKKDNPPFASNGVIRFNAPKGKIKEIYKALTNYLESLFLKELSEEGEVNEDIYSSLGIDVKSRRGKKSPKSRATREPVGERDLTGIHDSSRGDVNTESSGSGEPSSEVASGGDSQDSGETESGD